MQLAGGGVGVEIKHLNVLMMQGDADHLARVRSVLATQGFDADVVGVRSPQALREALSEQVWHALLVDTDVGLSRPLAAFELADALAPGLLLLLISPALAGDVGVFAWRSHAILCIGLDGLERIGPAVVRGVRAAESPTEPERDVLPLLAAIDARLAAAEVANGDAARSEVARARTLVAAAIRAGCEDLEGDTGSSLSGAAPAPCSTVTIDVPASGGDRTLPLTARQLEVLKLIAEGHSTREIATTLSLSVKTVESHRAQILLRVGARGVAGLVRYAVRTGLVDANS